MDNRAKTSVWKIVLIIFIIFLMLIIFFRIIGKQKNNNNDIPNPNENYSGLPKFDFYPPKLLEGQTASDTLIITVHGGAWVGGDKNYMSGMANYFSKKGYSVINTNYRLIPLKENPSINIFDQMTDISSVIKEVDKNKAKYKLSENYKIVLIGHSAGAHLSSFYGVDENKYGTKNIDYVVGIAGPYDLNIPSENSLSWIVRKYVIANYGTDAVSPSENIEMEDRTKFLLILGEKDELVPIEQLTNFEKKLKDKNVYVETLIVDGRTHNSIVEQIPYNDIVSQKILEFI